jgi:tetratricopeptide (TPR) repeat protein
MDQFSAHLDRGWDMVQRGDTRSAEASARKALEIDPHSPEAFNLLGYVAALEGDSAEAIENYRQAVALDDTYMEAMLNAAEVYIHPLGEFDEAIAMCEQALNLSETDEETIDTLLLIFDAMLGKGEVDAARGVIARMPSGPYENVNHTFLVGRAFYEIGEAARALPLVEEAARRDPNHSESWYFLGLIRDERGDAHAATDCFLRSRELDLREPPVAWAASREQFQKTVQSAIRSLEDRYRRFVSEAEVYVSEIPGIELVADGIDPRALLLLDGLASPEMPGPACSRIFVYQRNLERVAGCPDKVQEEIQAALQREISAVFLEGEGDATEPKHQMN